MATAVNNQPKQKVILIDGECILCTRFSKLVLRWDKKGQFLFSSRQSEQGRVLLREFALPPDLDSILYLEDGQLFSYSTAVLKVLPQLGGFWKTLRLLLLVPRPIRDGVYKGVAAMRYRWFGRQEEAVFCELPSP
ncbi:MAG: DUF393 domain-containing protein, partial [Phaeodactylibacter sp.]|nr:DUF393 domain-containing protein [Phaeodactylibacter sp.]